MKAFKQLFVFSFVAVLLVFSNKGWAQIPAEAEVSSMEEEENATSPLDTLNFTSGVDEESAPGAAAEPGVSEVAPTEPTNATTGSAPNPAPTIAPTTAPAESPKALPKAVRKVSPTKSLNQGASLKTAANEQYTKPVYFEQSENGVILPPMELEYDLTQDGGNKLVLGNVNFSEKNFFFKYVALERTHPAAKSFLRNDELVKKMLIINWPAALFKTGTLEMISKNGEVLWTRSIKESEVESWNLQLQKYKEILATSGMKKESLRNRGLFSVKFAFDPLEEKAPFRGQSSFRFCLSSGGEGHSSRLCSRDYATQTRGADLIMGLVAPETDGVRVIVNGTDSPLKNVVVLKQVEAPVSFYAQLASNESYEFIARPNKLKLMDIADSKNIKELGVIGYETYPIGNVAPLKKEVHSLLTRLLSFESTIGDFREMWISKISKEDPKLYLPGQGGGVFKQRFVLENIPLNVARVYLDKKSPQGTYKDGIRIRGRKLANAVVRSNQNSVKLDPKDSNHFDWYFKARKVGEINRSYLDIGLNGQKYRSYYELYKAHDSEVSGRLIGVNSASDLIILAEVAFNHWFEDIFGWDNYWVSRQRWGVSAKYFKSLIQLTVNDQGGKADLTVKNMDLKYRLSPGLWARDETLGVMLSYQDVSFSNIKAGMLGGGFFWARSMPKGLDKLISLLPLLDSPKWVDVEFIYYASPLEANIKLLSSMSLNFHGKVLWTDRFFGEAGFGVKRYGIRDSASQQKAELNTLYGTLGVGINF